MPLSRGGAHNKEQSGIANAAQHGTLSIAQSGITNAAQQGGARSAG
jgi:hypothetical protein